MFAEGLAHGRPRRIFSGRRFLHFLDFQDLFFVLDDFQLLNLLSPPRSRFLPVRIVLIFDRPAALAALPADVAPAQGVEPFLSTIG